MSNPTPTGQDEARRALATELALGIIHATGGDPKRAQEAASAILASPLAALRAPSQDRGAEEMKEACLKAASSASYGPPSSWPGDFPRGWRHPPDWDEDRTPTPTEAAWHDNGARDAWFAIRALAQQAKGEGEGGGDAS